MNRFLGFVLLLFALLYSIGTVAQCTIGGCVGIDCGEFNASFMPEGGPVFCDGQIITLNNTSDIGFDFFVVDWGGGDLDTMYDYTAFTNAFIVPEEELCTGMAVTTFSICFIAYKNCEAGISCQSGALDFGIRKRPTAILGAPQEVCISDLDPFTNTSCFADTYLWDFGDGQTSDLENPSHQYDMPGNYTVTLTVTNDCGSDTDTRTIEVVEEPIANFTIDGPALGCAPLTLNFTDQSNSSSTTIWQIVPNDTTLWCFTDTTMNINTDNIGVTFKVPQIFTVTQLATTACGTIDFSLDIEVLEEASITIEPNLTGCNSLVVTQADLNLSLTGPVDEPSGWEIITNGMVTEIPGPTFPTTTFTETSTIVALANAACGAINDSLTVTIIPVEDIALSPDNPTQICQSGPPVQLVAAPPGGVWCPAGLIDPDGTIDPSLLPVGMQVFTYKLGEGTPCATDADWTIEIVESASATITPEIFCEDSGSSQLMVDTLPGGVWQGPGITDSVLGIFDPAIVGVDTVEITYLTTDDSGCPVQATIDIPVEPFPTISLTDTITLCLVDAEIDLVNEFNYEVNPTGGTTTWSGINVTPAGIFNSLIPTPLSVDFYTATATYVRNACVVTDSAYIELIDQPILELTRDSTVCIDEVEITLLANLSGGTWDGPGIDPQTGVITLADAGGGSFDYTYTFEPHPSCSQSAMVTVEIIDLQADLNAGEDVERCDGEVTTYLLTQEQNPVPSGGVWVGAGITDPLVGVVDVSQLVLDSTYVFNYCVEESTGVNDCEACTSINFIVHSNPVAAFAFDGTPCIGETFTMINNTTNNEGGTYFWDFGNGQTSTAFEPTFSYSEEDTFTLSLTATATYSSAICTSTAQQELFITTPPIAEFDLTQTEGCAPFVVAVDTNNSSGFNITQQWCVAGDTILGPDLGMIVLDSITTDSFFNVELKVTNLCGTVVASEQVLVHPYPIVRMGIDSAVGCSPLTTTFANATVGNPAYYEWTMGNGLMFTDSLPPPQTYTTPEDSVSVYLVTLLAGNECGEREVTKSITVNPPNVEAFIELDPTPGCQPYTVQPESFSTPGAAIAWEVVSPSGAELSSIETAPIFELTEAGVYTFYLMARGCGEHLDSATVEVLPTPEVSFTSPAYVCLGDTLHLTNTSENISGVAWDFGNGTTSDVYDAFVVYDSVGTYTVTLTGLSTLNQCPATFSTEIAVIGNPIASFSASDLSGCAPLAVDFTDSSIGQSALEYTWTFGDGTAAFIPNPSHDFLTPDTYLVTLMVRDSFGCAADTNLVNIIVHNYPIADFSFPDQPYCHRYDSLFLQSLAVDAISYEWQIGDSVYTTENPRILLPQPGPYDIVFSVENNFGCRASSTQMIQVLPSPLAAISSDETAGCEDLLVSFINESTAGETYIWDFGNGNNSVDVSPSHLFRDPDSYTVQLTVSNSNGCPDDEATLEITVHPEPTAAFEFDQPQYCGAPATITFVNNSLLNTANNWRFGLAGTSDETMPTFTFVDFGNYEVELIVTTPFGCSDSISKPLDVYGNPLGDFTVMDRDICDGDSVTFLNSSIEALAFRWEIEGIGILTEESPTVAFPGPGNYDVKLVAIYNDICQDSIELANYITVHEQPLAAFSFTTDLSDTIKGEVQFINLSQNADRFFWDLGDGTTTTEFEPFHEYFQNRFIQVELFAYNDNGGLFTCVDTTSLEVSPEWLGEFYAPNAMAPEYGSELVRVFQPVGIGIKAYTLQIFSPWNEQVWYTDKLENTAPAESWDGFYKGELVPQGAYSWIARLEYEDGNRSIRRGTVTVLR